MALTDPAEKCSIHIAKKGSNTYTKASYPVRCGIYSEIDTRQATFHFNLNDEIIRIIGKGANWPHPQEWLKRTVANDWIYYSTGGYTGVFETTGEYYLPNLPYPTNKSMGGTPFTDERITCYRDNWYEILSETTRKLKDIPGNQRTFINRILINKPGKLEKRTDSWLAITGGHISVLPPDTRHVDYNVIPLTIAQGCLYKCSFCKVKNKKPFKELAKSEITLQLDRLKEFYREDLPNYTSLFLGEHDALQAHPELICFAISEGYKKLKLEDSYFRELNTFMFGSITSLLSCPQSLFDDLEKLPGKHFINIGLESCDQQTLDLIGKPVQAHEVSAAFTRMQEINDRYSTIEITANFIIDESLPDNHFTSLSELLWNRLNRTRTKGCIYLSPMQFDKPSRLKLFDFYQYKLKSRLPLFLYTIQRL